jgi:membrane-associated PAP2 superfamily phosphatase
MNRTGLLVALAVAVLAGVLFAVYPELDLRIAGSFFDHSKNDFALRWRPHLGFLRDAGMWVVALVIAPAIAALVLKLVLPRRQLLISARAILFLLVTLALGPGIIVNVGLKDYWARARPIDVPQFGGSERFTPWWDPRGDCPKNCSFVAGEASGAFWTLAPAALAPPAWRAAAYAAALTFGTGVGLLRMSFGAHFLSDVMFAGVFMFLLIWTLHGLIFRWRPTRLSEGALEDSLTHAALGPRRAWAAFARRYLRRPTGRET